MLLCQVVILVDVFSRRRESSKVAVLVLGHFVLTLFGADEHFVSFVFEIYDVWLDHETFVSFACALLVFFAAGKQHVLDALGFRQSRAVLSWRAVRICLLSAILKGVLD